MNESLDRLLASLSDPTTGPDIADVEALVKEYPFFTLPAILALKHHRQQLPPDLREQLMATIALNSPDPQRSFMLADVDYEEWINFYPQVSNQVTTNDAISKFLETYGHTDPHEEALLERLIFNPTPDYSSLLAREEEQNLPAAPADPADNSQDALINSFILKHKDDESDLLPRPEQPNEAKQSGTAGDTPTPTAPAGEAATPVPHTPPVRHTATIDTSLSESLAKIYIRQKRYDKAFEIIHTLSLNNPKKSAYFADQLRFLRKLMLNRNSANQDK